ncbi:DNA polymerase theta-like [Petromyzon marinus]|uniref:DNA polymerase theta-like n=1 Tax=Petromyzon marinus TaxID=7757 RepID=UPI003F6FED9C
MYLTHKKRLSLQLVAMSATLSAGSSLARWLGASWFSGSFRPVPLREIVKAGSSLYTTDGGFLGTYTPRLAVKGDPDHVVSLVYDVAHLGHSVLIFCPTRAWCERLSLLIAGAFRDLVTSGGPVPPVPVDEVSLSHLVRCLRRCPSGLDSTLARTIPVGVAFHHAGLTVEERSVLEEAYRSTSLLVLVSTHSLTHSPTHSPTHPLTHSPTHPPTHSPTHPLTHPPTHPPTHPGLTVEERAVLEEAYRLTVEERSVLEEAYRSTSLLVLVSTHSLSAGVNLPARRVILRGAIRAGAGSGAAMGNPCPLTPQVYVQMSGRAGRAGIERHDERARWASGH